MSRPLRIAFVTASASRLAGGLYSSVRRLAQSLEGAGHGVEVFALDDAHGAEDAAAWLPLVPARFPRRGPAALGFAPALAAALAAERFDVVHQHGIWQGPSLAVGAWRRRTGRPVMISPRGMLDPWAVRNSGWKKRIAGALYERANLSGAAVLHALGAPEAEAIRAFGLSQPVAVIPNGTDLPDGRAAARPAFLPPDGRRTLLFVGRIHPKKGVAELIEAHARLKARRDGLAAAWRLVVAGWDDGGHLAAIERRVGELGLAGDVVLPGPLYGAGKDAALRHADAFVLPSRSEGLPMAVLEAWAYGLPVAMTDACNLPEGFAHGAAYRLALSPAALEDGLAAVFAADDLARRGAAGRALVEARFGWAGIARRHAAVYRAMCGDPAFRPLAGTFAEAEPA